MVRSRWQGPAAALAVALAMVLVAGLAACSGDQDDPPTPTPSAEPGASAPPLDLSTGPGLSLGGADSPAAGMGLVGRLPGCSGEDAEDCPAPVNLPLDAEASAGDITVSYLSRYFEPATAPPDGVAIRIVPNERFPFEQQATFDVYRAASVESAVGAIEATDSGPWTSAQGWDGIIAVQRDGSQDPPVNTSIGAFALPDGQALVLRAVTTGQYGWDVWSVIYEQMLNSLVVGAAGPAEG